MTNSPPINTEIDKTTERQHDYEPVETPSPNMSMMGCMMLLGQLFQEPIDSEQAQSAALELQPLKEKAAAKRFAKALNLSLKHFTRPRLDKLKDKDLPLAFKSTTGEWIILAKVSGEKALLQKPGMPQPLMIPLDQLSSFWSGQCLTVAGRQRQTGKMRPFNVTWFIPEFMRYRKLIGEVLLASAFVQLLALIFPLFFQVITDKVLPNQSYSTLDVLVFVVVIVAIMEIGLKGLRDYLMSHTMSRVDCRLGGHLFTKLMNLPYAYFQARSVGITVNRLRELSTIREFLIETTNTLIIDLGFIFIFLGVMFYYSPTLTYIVLASFPAFFLLSYLISSPLQKRIEELFQCGAVNQSFLTEVLTGSETVKSLALEPQLIRRWGRQMRDFAATNFNAQILQQTGADLTTLIEKITLVIVIWIGARQVIGLEMSLGQLIAFNMMANHVMQPVIRLSQLWREFVQTRVSVERLGDVLNTPEERQTHLNSLPETIKGELVFRDITFQYQPDAPPVLKNLSFHISPGQMVAFVGASGSGKSTVAKLLQKLYIPQQGQYFLDGADIAHIDPASLRANMSVVLQENYLFNQSVRQNIALTCPAAPLSEVIEAAKAAGAHDFILEMPEGYDTEISEGGRSLSGGQRQRIAIARALLARPKILIFDEATSALDDVSQHIIQQNMATIRQDKTMILIAHRLSTVRDCDRIFVVDKGQIIEAGTHPELLALQGRYAHLWSMQKGAPDTTAQLPLRST